MSNRIEKIETLQKIYEEILFGIVRTSSQESAIGVSRALIEGGVRILEVSLNTPGAFGAIERLVKESGSAAIVGVGTVLDATSARLAIDAGSRFIVSPTLSREIIEMGNRYGVPVIPGIGTASELLSAMEWGVDVVKGFPGDVLGYGFIKSLVGPLPQARVIPVGGVSKENMQQWLDSGAYALGLGKGLTHPGGSCDDVSLIKKNAAEFISCLAREKMKRSAK